jgi:hypothetical protein
MWLLEERVRKAVHEVYVRELRSRGNIESTGTPSTIFLGLPWMSDNNTF